MSRCPSTKNNGNRCRQTVLEENGRCKYHQADKFAPPEGGGAGGGQANVIARVPARIAPPPPPPPTVVEMVSVGTQTESIETSDPEVQTGVVVSPAESPARVSRRCGWCRAVGHDRRSCPDPRVQSLGRSGMCMEDPDPRGF